MSPKPRQTTVLVTGCSENSIGSALAAEFHRRGCRVFATVRDAAKATHLSAIGITDIVILDVASPASVAAATASVRAAIIGTADDDDDGVVVGLDILVNNAGVGYSATFLDSDIAACRHLFDVNVWGVVAVTKAFAPLLVASGRGRVVNIGSIFGDLHPPFTSFYNATKAALRSLSTSMRVEMAPLGVKVTYVSGNGRTAPFSGSVPKVSMLLTV